MGAADQQTLVEQLAARLAAVEQHTAALEQENAGLQAKVASLEARRAAGLTAHPPAAPSHGAGAGQRVSRHGVLKTALGAAVATVGAGAVLERQSGIARADGPEGQTSFSTSGEYAVSVQCTASSGTGIDIKGPGAAEASDYWGVSSHVYNGIGVRAASTNATAIRAYPTARRTA